MKNAEREAVERELLRKYMIPPEVLFQEIDGDVVLLSKTTGNYYGINQMTSRMWNLILQRRKHQGGEGGAAPGVDATWSVLSQGSRGKDRVGS